ncbi:TetR/AcrR family transcriptional regulator [Cellulomonas alba]|uniref:TetR/AcrR family transcriptional regulator n=1 Tax=Cellulomonas alba TaxID=3053467 RepID=A0ABT7SDG3_9CELL|nr:TetR/AcrR family transcriptional regulator [Cellulomonas alba]MDM7854228.1 TetR/AcrR family transcriptional regulator [Cellulomonas alba]
MTAAPVPPSAGSARERARATFTADLLAAARRQVAEVGAAQLSLRGVARELGVASSAVYRYVDSRDALLTLLLIEAFDDGGAACETAFARARAAGASAGETWIAVARAFRAWATEHRHAYELAYGTPVPGYVAPQDTVSHATRVWGVLGRVIVAAAADGDLAPLVPPADVRGLVSPAVLEFAGSLADDGRAAPGTDAEEGVVRSVVLFDALVGAVSTELFGHLHGVTTDADRLFDVTIAAAATGVGLVLRPAA